MKKRFFIYGFMGTTIETLWTGLNSLLLGNLRLISRTSLWMILIYGLMTLCEPVFKVLKNKPLIIRGLVYTALIFSAEYLTGHFLRSFGICPWDYSYTTHSINGLIRPDYAPLWFAAGLFYEKLYFFLRSLVEQKDKKDMRPKFPKS